MIYIEKIKNNDCDNEGIFYTSKYPLISCGFNAYYHMTKDKFEKIKMKIMYMMNYQNFIINIIRKNLI